MKNAKQELAFAVLVVKYPPFFGEELRNNILFYKKSASKYIQGARFSYNYQRGK
jgi:hypothetical protein